MSVTGSVGTYHAAAVGEPLAVGCMMWDYRKFKGMYATTPIHAIADFYHVCEYLAAASHGATMELSERNCWLETQKPSP